MAELIYFCWSFSYMFSTMRYCTRQKMLCFRNHHCTVSISLECINEASEVWSGILEVILLILMKVHACVCMYGLLHYWKKPSVMKKPSTTEKAIHFIKEVFKFVVKRVQMYVHSTDMYSMALKVPCIIQVNRSFTKLLICIFHLGIESTLTYLCW